MKTLSFTTVLFLLVSSCLPAQTTITNSSFFEVGDVLFTAVDNLPEGIDVGEAAGNQNWDFSNLTSAQVDMTEVYPASAGAGSFPNADAYINMAADGELYLDIKTDAIEQLGFVGTQFGLDLNIALSPTSNYRRAPIQYQDEFTESYGLNVTLPSDQIPFLDSINLPINPDSMRLTQIVTTAYHADAWGTVQLPMGTYDALRLHRTQNTSTLIEAFLPIIGWVDVTDAVLSSVPEFADAEVQSYEFLADGVKESLAILELNPADSTGTAVVQATYKADPNATDVVNPTELDNSFVASPNPAYADVEVYMRGIPAGDYELALFDMAGRRMLSRRLSVDASGENSMRFSVSSLPKGTYIYALRDKKGEVLRAKRLIIIKP